MKTWIMVLWGIGNLILLSFSLWIGRDFFKFKLSVLDTIPPYFFLITLVALFSFFLWKKEFYKEEEVIVKEIKEIK